MSTLKVNDIIEATSGGGKVFQCRVYCNYNQSGTISVTESGNVSSIVDESTGIATISFSNSLANANYSAPATSQAGQMRIGDTAEMLSSAILFVVENDGGSNQDKPINTFVVVGTG